MHWIAVLLWVGVTGCAASEVVDTTATQQPQHPMQAHLVGQTREAVFSCAGPPLRERAEQSLTWLRYYREAPLLEESFVGSKGSHPRPHHGCWAELIVKDEHIIEVRYRSVPANVDSSDHCEEIFARCGS
jgi:hypothetical protein